MLDDLPQESSATAGLRAVNGDSGFPPGVLLRWYSWVLTR